MHADDELGWGEWLKRRIAFVGIRSQKRAAATIGCTEQCLCAWQRMEVPPGRMKSGFDELLCAVLKTDRLTLFNGWKSISPEVAPIIDAGAVNEVQGLKRKIYAMAELLEPDQLRKFVESGESILHAPACVA